MQLKRYFTRYRNNLHSLIKRSKFNYYKDKIQEAGGDSRKFWTVVNEMAGRPTGKDPFPVEAFSGVDGTVTSDEVKVVSNSINEYFASVGSRLAESIAPAGPPQVRDVDHPVNSVFTLRPVTREEIFEIVHKMKGGSAPGWDGIPSEIYKKNIDVLIQPIHYIINLSISCGEFPDLFKIAKVIPIFKSGSKSEIINYRPISLLATFSKILEKCIKIQLTNYLESEKILTESQYGFRQHLNTSNALFDITKIISQTIGNKKRVLLTFLDLAKAFDSVNRKKLIAKLKSIGLNNISLQWFASYFENRTQMVTINGVLSEKVPVDYGVVQGSTLGPLLFLIYINNITKMSLKGFLLLFADDTVLVSTGCTWDEAYNQASSDLAKIKNWFDHNTLTVNIGKTKHLPIYIRADMDPGPRVLRMHSCGDPSSATCGCGIVERVEQYKYLGITIDHKLNWVPHVQSVKRRLRKMIYAFMQLSRVLTMDQLRTVYFAYVQSVLQYGVLAWGGASAAVLEPLAVTQRSIIKIILKNQ